MSSVDDLSQTHSMESNDDGHYDFFAHDAAGNRIPAPAPARVIFDTSSEKNHSDFKTSIRTMLNSAHHLEAANLGNKAESKYYRRATRDLDTLLLVLRSVKLVNEIKKELRATTSFQDFIELLRALDESFQE